MCVTPHRNQTTSLRNDTHLWGGYSQYDRLNYRSLLQKRPIKEPISAKETCNLIDHTDCSRPIRSRNYTHIYGWAHIYGWVSAYEKQTTVSRTYTHPRSQNYTNPRGPLICAHHSNMCVTTHHNKTMRS